jgi:ABC-type glycerol-3-phosphate transport system substrate-binding protein
MEENVMSDSTNKKYSRRGFLKASSALVGMSVIAACVPVAPPPAAQPAAESKESPAEAPAAEAMVIEAWSRMTGLAQESIMGIIENYNAQNTMGTTVEFVYIAQTEGSQADEKLMTAVAGGTPPALHYADRFTVPQFAHQGFF